MRMTSPSAAMSIATEMLSKSSGTCMCAGMLGMAATSGTVRSVIDGRRGGEWRVRLY